MSEQEAILSLDRLSVRLPRGADRTHALQHVSLEIASNEILCVVGESGSGKSMMANAVMRLLPNEVAIDDGRIMFEGRDLCAASVAEMREVRGRIDGLYEETAGLRVLIKTHENRLGLVFKHMGNVIDDQWEVRAGMDELKCQIRGRTSSQSVPIKSELVSSSVSTR